MTKTKRMRLRRLTVVKMIDNVTSSGAAIPIAMKVITIIM